MPRPGETVQFFQDLADINARAGRTVRLGATVYGLREDPTGPASGNANQVLGRFLRNAGTGNGPDARQVREAPGGFVLETSREGQLSESWTVPALLRSIQEATVQSLRDSGHAPGAVEAFALDLDADAREVTYNPVHGDTTGEINPDGTLNYGAILEHGTEEGLSNVGELGGKVLKTVGAATGEGLLGFARGLGVVGTIVLVLVLLAVVFILVKGAL